MVWRNEPQGKEIKIGKPFKSVIRRAETTIDPPYCYNSHNIVMWEPKSKELKVLGEYAGDDVKKQIWKKNANSWLAKAREFLDNDCIERISKHEFICKPIKGYNKTTYTIFIDEDGEPIECNCQGFQTKAKEGNGFCSHCLAVKQFQYIEKYSKEPPKRVFTKGTKTLNTLNI